MSKVLNAISVIIILLLPGGVLAAGLFPNDASNPENGKYPLIDLLSRIQQKLEEKLEKTKERVDEITRNTSMAMDRTGEKIHRTVDRAVTVVTGERHMWPGRNGYYHDPDSYRHYNCYNGHGYGWTDRHGQNPYTAWNQGHSFHNPPCVKIGNAVKVKSPAIRSETSPPQVTHDSIETPHGYREANFSGTRQINIIHTSRGLLADER